MTISTCIGCGCNDTHACHDEATGGPCHWLRLEETSWLGVCSACPEHVTRWDEGDREVAVPVDLGHDKLGDPHVEHLLDGMFGETQ